MPDEAGILTGVGECGVTSRRDGLWSRPGRVWEFNMTLRHLARVVICASLVLAAVTVSAKAGPRAVVELFTSQGCSSCPAADQVMGELAKDPSLIALSLAVDYWDYLGWKDTLALSGHSSRQRAYSKARGDREVYTPQVVVNGLVHALGSDKTAIERAIAVTRAEATPLSVPTTVSLSDDKVTVNVAASNKENMRGEVWLCPVSRHVAVPIERGENRGKTLVYHNVVRRWIKLGDWTGKAVTWTVPRSEMTAKTGPSDNIDQVAVIVQGTVANYPGAMLGAATAALR